MQKFERSLKTAIKKYISAADRKKYPEYADFVEMLLNDNAIKLQRENAKRWRLLNDLDNTIKIVRKELCKKK